MQLAYLLALCNHNITISVCSESLPHLKRGAMKDFFDFLKNNNLYSEKNHNRSNQIYTINTSKVEFFSIDSPEKIHGASRDILFVNEIQNIRYETFFQLVQRTNLRVYADYNPICEFWVHTQFLNNIEFKDDIQYIHSTLFDNDFLSQHIKQDVLRRAKTDHNYRRVYLEGKIGTLEGLIYPDFNIVDLIPEDATRIPTGVDFGFSNSPTAIVDLYLQNGEIYINELLYETGLLNQQITKYLPQDNIIIADCAEPKSISEIRRLGYNIYPATKGADSIQNGISKVKSFKLNVTKQSVNIIRELRTYHWLQDKDGKFLNVPVKKDDHALDAIRYVISKHNVLWQ